MKKLIPLMLALLVAACGSGQNESGMADDSSMMADSTRMEGETGGMMEDSSSMGSGMMADSSSMGGTMAPDTTRMRE